MSIDIRLPLELVFLKREGFLLDKKQILEEEEEENEGIQEKVEFETVFSDSCDNY